jgi:uncharacterized protein
MQESLNLLKTIIKKELSNLEGSAHSYKHTERVYKTAIQMAEQEKADLNTIKVASLLHDIGRAYGEPHNETAIEPARKAVETIKYPEKKRDEIIHIILNHRVSDREKLKTVEGKIVWDADKLDLIGMIGVSRAFHYAAETGVSFEDSIIWGRNRATDNPYIFHAFC